MVRKSSKKVGGGGGGGSKHEVLEDVCGMFKQMPPNKRNELNVLVDKLLKVTSNMANDEPNTSTKLHAEFEEIFGLVEKVRTLEQQFNMTRRLGDSRQLHMASFLRWLDDQGAKTDGLQIATDCYDARASGGVDRGLGLKTVKRLKKGDAVITVPRKCFMSAETARSSTLSSLMATDPMLKTMPNVALSLHLLLEKNSPASFWEPYINVLPRRYSTVLYFSPQDFLQLKGSPAFDEAVRQFKYIARQYAYFYTKFQTTMLRDYFTFDDYRWAVSTVMTRQNQVPSSSTGTITTTTNALIPFWDFCNHESSSLDGDACEVSTDYDDENDATVCLANRDFRQGEEFTIFYGTRSNSDFLVHNGFVPATNVHNSLILKLGVGKSDPLAESKLELLELLTIPRQGLFFPITMKDKPFDNVLLAFLRILCLRTKDAADAWSRDEKFRDLLNDSDNNDPDELDKMAFKYLETRCSLLLASYPTSLEQDMEMLSEPEEELTTNKTSCLVLRSQEKKILLHTIAYCKSKCV